MANNAQYVFRSTSTFPRDLYEGSCYSWVPGQVLPIYSRVMLTARELCLLYPDLFVTPILTNGNEVTTPKIWILRPKSGMKKSSQHGIKPLEERLKDMALAKVNVEADVGPSSAVLKAAFQFTIQARLSPQWNRVGQLFMEGRDCLATTVTSYVEAKLVLAADSRVTITVNGGKVRFPSLDLRDFQVDPQILAKFEKGETDLIPDHFLGMTSVCVVPNLTRAKIVSISRDMLTSNELKDWKDMKRYWKNMYGIRWPSTFERPRFFVNVTFGFWRGGDEVYSYPDLCVRPFEPYPLPRVRQEPIIVKFIRDLKEKVPSIFGVSLDFPLDEAGIPSSELLPAKSNESTKKDLSKIEPSTSNNGADRIRNVCSEGGISAGGDQPRVVEEKPRYIPKFLPSQQPKNPRLFTPPSTPTISRIVPSFQPNRPPKSNVFTPNSFGNSKSTHEAPKANQSQKRPVTTPAQPTVASMKAQQRPVQPNQNTFQKRPVAAPSQPTVVPMKAQQRPIQPRIETEPQRSQPQKRPVGPFQSSLVNELSQSLSQSKKPRPDLELTPTMTSAPVKRPKSTISVEDAARSGQLKKVNIPTLVEWLRARKIPCKVKEKKEELVTKVKSHLGLSNEP